MKRTQLLKAINESEQSDQRLCKPSHVVNPDNIHFVDHCYRIDGTFGLVALVLEDCAQDALDTLADEGYLSSYEVEGEVGPVSEANNDDISYLGNYDKPHNISELRITRIV